MPELSLQTYALLLVAGFFAGFVDSIAGGGGLISLPALLSVGVPPHMALGTNKLQSSFGALTASINYSRKGLVDFRGVLAGILFTALGAVGGTVTIQLMSAKVLGYIIPVLLVAVFFYTLFSPEFGEADRTARLPKPAFYFVCGMVLGFYDGFFGPGTGSFWAITFVLLLGLNLKKATAHTKIMNFTSNIVSLAAFVIGGNVLFLAGLTMALGQITGAAAGSNLVVKKGVGFIRFFFMTVVALTIMKLIYSAYIA